MMESVGAIPAQPLDISVVIPIYGRHRLQDCLQALSGQLNGALTGEVILVDNNPVPDESLRALARTHAFSRYVHEAEAGSYSARNRAIAIAKGEILAFTDADCLPATGWLSAGHQAISQGADLVAGKVDIAVLPVGRRQTAVESYESVFAFRQEATVAQNGYGVTANLFARRALFEAIGKFDRQLFSGGDLEWCIRATSQGYQIAYSELAAVSHPPRAGLREMLRKGRRVAGGQVMLRHTVPLLARYFTLPGIIKSLLPPFRQYGRIARVGGGGGPATRLGMAGVATLNKYNISLWRLLYLLGLSSDIARQ